MEKKLVILVLLLLTADLFAQKEVSRIGTSGAQFLKLGVGARACALGESMVAVRGDATGLFWNVAAIASIEKKSLVVSRNELYVNLNYNFLGFVLPLKHGSAVGINVLYLDSGDMEVTTVDQPEGTGDFFSWQSYSIGVSYARFLTDRLSLGATIKYIREGTFGEIANGLAVDLGALLDTGILGFRLGLNMSNIGDEMRFSSPKAPGYNGDDTGYGGIIREKSLLQTQSYPLPLTFRLGLSTDLLGKHSQIMPNQKNRLTLSMNAHDPNDSFLRANFGLEYEWNSLFALRAGYRGIAIEGDPMDEYSTGSYSFGVGVKYAIDFLRFQLDYAFMDYKVLGNAHHFSLGFEF
ncbi:MAG TPA: PorV/PorQ family protein [bacterium]|nr:PorV/PorQ family protein [bacterium]